MDVFRSLGDILTSSRFKSFYWRVGMMALAGFLALLAESIGQLEVNAGVASVVGLMLGEASKAINNMVKKKPTGFRSAE